MPFCQTSVAASELNHDRGKIEMTLSNTRFEILHSPILSQCNQSEKEGGDEVDRIGGVFDEGKCVLQLNCRGVQVAVE